MKLYKALKLRKNLVGEITKIKNQIKEKNSYLEGSKNGEKFDSEKAYDELLSKIDELTGLKFVVNEANREIQARIYLLGEYKALIAFWNEVSVVEGTQIIGYSDKVQTYVVQVDEESRNKIVKDFQTKVDVIQEELDEYNFTTEIPWGDMSSMELEEMTLKTEINEVGDLCNDDTKSERVIPNVPPEDRSKLHDGHDSKEE